MLRESPRFAVQMCVATLVRKQRRQNGAHLGGGDFGQPCIGRCPMNVRGQKVDDKSDNCFAVEWIEMASNRCL